MNCPASVPVVYQSVVQKVMRVTNVPSKLEANALPLRTRLAPASDMGAVRFQVVHDTVAVAIGDEDVPVQRVDSHISRPIEHAAGLRRRTCNYLTKDRVHLGLCPQHPALWGEDHEAIARAVALGDQVREVINKPKIILVVDKDRMWSHELRPAPARQCETRPKQRKAWVG